MQKKEEDAMWWDTKSREVIYIDRDHLHRVGTPDATASEAKDVR